MIRLIPQGTVDNNLRPDRFAGQKAEDPYYCRQPTLWLRDICLEILTVYGNGFRLFWAMIFSQLILFISHIWQSSSRYNFTHLAITRFRHRSISLDKKMYYVLLCIVCCLLSRNQCNFRNICIGPSKNS